MAKKDLRQQNIRHFPFSILPTPFHKLSNISRDFGINLYCKRDDMTGFAMGGNKTRKLDFLIAVARKEKAEILLATGAVQSNFCRLAAAAGKVSGMDVHLVLGGRRPKEPTGNLLLNRIFGASVHFVESEDWTVWEEETGRLERRLSAKGKRVCRLPIGGSTPAGALGYLNAFLEIAGDCRRLNLRLDTIIHASSSGGTQAGLLTGKHLTGWKGRIIGIGVAKNDKKLTDEIYDLASMCGDPAGVGIDRKSVIVDNSYMGKAYGSPTSACGSAIRIFAEREGIILDSVYTGKAAAGILDYAERGCFKRGENVLFVHTGGSAEIFA